MFSFTSRPLYPYERTPPVVEQDAELYPEPIWKFWRRGESLVHAGFRTPDRPVILSTLPQRFSNFVLRLGFGFLDFVLRLVFKKELAISCRFFRIVFFF